MDGSQPAGLDSTASIRLTITFPNPRHPQNHGNELERARDLFYALWTPDLFMERVEKDGDWSLFCPNEAPGLAEVYGDEFKRLYEKYEKEGKARRTIKAQQLWFAILDSQVETGTPYMLVRSNLPGLT